MADELDPVTVEFGAKIDKLIAGIDASKSAVDGLDTHVSKLSDSFGAIGTVIAAAFSITALIEFGKKMGEIADQVQRAAQTVGLDPVKTSEMAAQASVLNVKLEDMVQIIRNLDNNLNSKDPFGRASQAIKILNIDVDKLTDLPVDQWIGKIAEQVSKLAPSVDRTNAIVALGGEEMIKMIVKLNGGGEAFKKLAEDVAKTGAVMSKEGIERAAQVGETFKLLALYTRGLGNDLWSAVGPAVENISKVLLDMAEGMRQSYREGGLTKTMFNLLGEAAQVLATSIAAVAGVIEGLGLAVATALNWPKTAAEAKKIQDEFERIGAKWIEVVKQIWSEAARPRILVSRQGEAGSINDDLRNEVLGKAAALDAQVSLQKAFQAQMGIIYQRDADLLSISNQEKFALTKQAVLDTYNIEADLLLEKRNLWAEGSRQWEHAERQRLLAAVQANSAIIQINADAAREIKARWDEVFGGLQSAINGQLRGLLAGTTSFKDAFKLILGDMLIFFIQMVEKMVFQWIAGKLAMAAVDATEVAKSVATLTATREATLPLKIAAFTSDITAAAALAFANTYAALAAVPPVAATAAAASSAVVLAQLAGVPKFELGTDYVPYTGLAMVPEGEKIVTAEENRKGNTGSGPTTFQITAWDGASIAMWLKRGGAQMLAKHVGKTMTDQRSARPTY